MKPWRDVQVFVLWSTSELAQMCPGPMVAIFGGTRKQRNGMKVIAGRYPHLRHLLILRLVTLQARVLSSREHELRGSNVLTLYFRIYWKAKGSDAHNRRYGSDSCTALLYLRHLLTLLLFAL